MGRRGMTDGRQPARDLMDWLMSDSMRDADGWTLSWAGSDKPPYAYPEISAYVLHLLARWPWPLSRRMTERALELQTCVQGQLMASGALSRGGIEYVFDTSVGIAALDALARAGWEIAPRALEKGCAFVREGLERGLACRREGAWFAGERWSLGFQPHLLKCLRAFSSSEAARAIAGTKLSSLLRHQGADGAFALDNGAVVDVHVHAYALEGLLAAREAPAVRKMLASGVDWLARLQLPDGGIPRNVAGSHSGYCDTTAQAVRLFILLDRDRYARNIELGLAWLRQLGGPQGGVRYHPGVQDCPAWGAVFTCQAHLMLAGLHADGDMI
jgi:hypothetical protein